MRFFASSIADGAPFKFLPAHQYEEVGGRRKSTESKWNVGMAKPG